MMVEIGAYFIETMRRNLLLVKLQMNAAWKYGESLKAFLGFFDPFSTDLLLLSSELALQ